MKNKKLIFSVFIFVFLLMLCNICNANDIDKINKYYITVNPRDDGSLDMLYYIEWEVLDSVSEGPLEWVKIGIANSKVDSVKAISKNIEKAEYYEENNEDFIRVDFKDSYETGDIVKFEFSLHQSYMYEIKNSKCIYEFTPGWFTDIEVKDISVLWDANKVKSSSAKKTNTDNYLVWQDSLKKGKKLKTKITYDKSAFTIDLGKQSTTLISKKSNDNNETYNKIQEIIVVLVFISVLATILSITQGAGRGYYSHGGLGYYDDDYDYGYHHHHHYHDSSYGGFSSSSSRSCVNSCACACACAGGGRAGCSKKDFYGTNLRTSNIKKIIESEKASN